MILTALQKLERAGQVANLLADLNSGDARTVLEAALCVTPWPQNRATVLTSEEQ